MNNRKLNIHPSQSEIALKIESLVKAIERSDTPAFRIRHNRSGYERLDNTRISRYCTHVQQMYNLFDDRVPYDYSEQLQAFRVAWEEIGLEPSPAGPICLNDRGSYWLSHPESMNVLTERIRELTRVIVKSGV